MLSCSHLVRATSLYTTKAQRLCGKIRGNSHENLLRLRRFKIPRQYRAHHENQQQLLLVFYDGGRLGKFTVPKHVSLFCDMIFIVFVAELRYATLLTVRQRKQRFEKDDES